MHDSKLIEVLQSLNSKELQAFLLFVQSPYFNRNKAVVELCSYLLKFAPSFENYAALEKVIIYKNIYPKSSYIDADFHSLFSKLLKLLYKFLALQIWEEEAENLQDIYLMQQARRRSLNEKHISLIRKQKESAHVHSIEAKIYYEDYLYYCALDGYELSFGIKNAHKNPVALKNKALDEYYIIEKLRIYCDMFNRSMLASQDYDFTLYKEIENYLKQYPLSQKNPLIFVYWQILQMLKNHAIESYETLKLYLQNNSHIFEESELKSIYSFAINFCIYEINSGDLSYYKDLKSYYEYLIKNSLLFKDNYLPALEYKQIITVYLRLKDYQIAKDFALAYKEKLIPAQRENIYNFNLANIFCEEGNFAASLSLLKDIELWDYSYQIGYRLIQTKAYFSLNESQAFYALIDAFVIFLKRNHVISEHIRLININFLRLCKKLFQLKEQFCLKLLNQERLSAKTKEIEAYLEDKSLQIANKLWLLEEFEKLKQSINGL